MDDFDGWKLTRGFIVHNYNYLQRETHLGLIFKMAPGLCFLFQKLITSYVLNDVLIDKDSASLLGAVGVAGTQRPPLLQAPNPARSPWPLPPSADCFCSPSLWGWSQTGSTRRCDATQKVDLIITFEAPQ